MNSGLTGSLKRIPDHASPQIQCFGLLSQVSRASCGAGEAEAYLASRPNTAPLSPRAHTTGRPHAHGPPPARRPPGRSGTLPRLGAGRRGPPAWRPALLMGGVSWTRPLRFHVTDSVALICAVNIHDMASGGESSEEDNQSYLYCLSKF